MNPNAPVTFYQVGAVNVNNGSRLVGGYETQWLSSTSPAKPVEGSIFTVDKSSYYLVESVNDDLSLVLNREYTGSSQVKISYLIMNDVDEPINPDDEKTMTQLIKMAKLYAGKAELYQSQAKGWAVKMDGPVSTKPLLYSAKYYAIEASKIFGNIGTAVADAEEFAKQAEASNVSAGQHEAASEQNKNDSANSATEAEASNVSAAEHDTNAAESARQAEASNVSAGDHETASEQNKNESATNAKLAKDFTIGPSATPPLDTPSDTNNAYYYFQQVLGLTSGAIAFGNMFTPSAVKEYPDKTPTSSLWIVTPSDPDGYTWTTGNMKGFTALNGDWFVYYKTLDTFELLKVSPLHTGSVGQASELVAGILKIATEAVVDAGVDDTSAITALKLAQRLSKLTASDVGARPDDWMPTYDEVGALTDHATVNGYSLKTNPTLNADDVGAATEESVNKAVGNHAKLSANNDFGHSTIKVAGDTLSILTNVPSETGTFNKITVDGKEFIPQSNSIYVVESGKNNKGWYRKWSNDFIEQGGVVLSDKVTDTQELPIPFATDDEWGVIPAINDTDKAGATSVRISNAGVSKESFEWIAYGTTGGLSADRFYWVASGF